MTDPGPPRTVLHLTGSPTDAFFDDLSRLYAQQCLDATTVASPWRTLIAHVDPSGRWTFPADLTPDAIACARPMSMAGALATIVDLAPDVAVPQMFCVAGMTAYRALLDDLGVPFVGNVADVMALTAHKDRAKVVVRDAGVRVPDGTLLSPKDLRSGTDLARAVPSWPVVVKPADADNSAGVSYVDDPANLYRAVEEAFKESERVMIEEYIPLGREVRCGVLETRDGLVVLPLEEYAVDAASKPVRDAADKLRRDPGDELRLVAKDADHAWIVANDDPVVPAVARAALTCHRALGCRDYSLFDFRIDPAGEPVFLEAGLYCSFAPSSVIAAMAASAGIALTDLYADAVVRAAGRGR